MYNVHVLVSKDFFQKHFKTICILNGENNVQLTLCATINKPITKPVILLSEIYYQVNTTTDVSTEQDKNKLLLKK